LTDFPRRRGGRSVTNISLQQPAQANSSRPSNATTRSAQTPRDTARAHHQRPPPSKPGTVKSETTESSQRRRRSHRRAPAPIASDQEFARQKWAAYRSRGRRHRRATEERLRNLVHSYDRKRRGARSPVIRQRVGRATERRGRTAAARTNRCARNHGDTCGEQRVRTNAQNYRRIREYKIRRRGLSEPARPARAVRPSPSSNRNKNCDVKYEVWIPTVVSWSVCRERVCWIVGSSHQPRTTTQHHESVTRGLAVVGQPRILP